MWKQLQHQIVPLLLLFLLGSIWGSGYAIARFATTHEVSPLGYAFWQSLGPAILLGIIVVVSKRKLFPHKNYSKFYLICGLLGIAVPNSNMYFAAPHLPASLLAVLVNTVPLVTYALALLFNQEKFTWLRFFGIVIGFIGIASLIVPTLNWPEREIFKWMCLALLTPFCFALCAIYSANFQTHESDSLSLAAGMLLFSSLLLLPIVITTHSFYSFSTPLKKVDWIILLEIILSSAGYFLFFLLLKKAGPVYYSLVGGIVMLTGLFWGWLIFNETFSLIAFVSVLFILSGVYLVTLGQRKHLRG